MGKVNRLVFIGTIVLILISSTLIGCTKKPVTESTIQTSEVTTTQPVVTFEQKRTDVLNYIRTFNNIENNFNDTSSQTVFPESTDTAVGLIAWNVAVTKFFTAIDGAINRLSELKPSPLEPSTDTHLQQARSLYTLQKSIVQEITDALNLGNEELANQKFDEFFETRDTQESLYEALEQLMLKYNIPYSEVDYIRKPRMADSQIEAATTELSNIKAAVVALMVDNELGELPSPVTVATDDMSAFPDTSICGFDKILGPISSSLDNRPSIRKPYVRGGDKNGYLLYQHDIVADGMSIDLVDYVATQYTNGTYTVDKYGTVRQVTTGYE